MIILPKETSCTRHPSSSLFSYLRLKLPLFKTVGSRFNRKTSCTQLPSSSFSRYNHRENIGGEVYQQYRSVKDVRFSAAQGKHDDKD